MVLIKPFSYEKPKKNTPSIQKNHSLFWQFVVSNVSLWPSISNNQFFVLIRKKWYIDKVKGHQQERKLKNNRTKANYKPKKATHKINSNNMYS